MLLLFIKDCQDFKNYIEKYGFHFTKLACYYAINKMYTNKGNLQMMPIEKVNTILDNNKINVDKSNYDYVYVLHMGMADFLGSSIADELHLAKFVGDVMNDIDLPEGYVFNRWLSDMQFKELDINWKDLI